MEDLYINPKIILPSDCFSVAYSRSSGPGGQHVNKLNTRATVFFDVSQCPCLTDRQKLTLSQTLSGRMDKNGVMQVSSQQFRSQLANQNAAFKRMAALIESALKPKRVRKKTRTPKKAVEKRLQDKKYHSKRKQLRSEKPQTE